MRSKLCEHASREAKCAETPEGGGGGTPQKFPSNPYPFSDQNM